MKTVSKKTLSKPPRKVINNLISRTRKLIRGRVILVEVAEYGVILNCDVSWQSDRSAELDAWSLSPMKETTDREKKLIDLIDDIYEINCIFEKFIFRSQQFKAFETEIKQLCMEVDRLQKQFKKFDWEEDVLIPAETSRR